MRRLALGADGDGADGDVDGAGAQQVGGLLDIDLAQLEAQGALFGDLAPEVDAQPRPGTVVVLDGERRRLRHRNDQWARPAVGRCAGLRRRRTGVPDEEHRQGGREAMAAAGDGGHGAALLRVCSNTASSLLASSRPTDRTLHRPAEAGHLVGERVVA